MKDTHIVQIGASRGISSTITLARCYTSHFTLIDPQKYGRENIGQLELLASTGLAGELQRAVPGTSSTRKPCGRPAYRP